MMIELSFLLSSLLMEWRRCRLPVDTRGCANTIGRLVVEVDEFVETMPAAAAAAAEVGLVVVEVTGWRDSLAAALGAMLIMPVPLDRFPITPILEP